MVVDEPGSNGNERVTENRERGWLVAWCAWTVLSIAFSLAVSGPTPDAVTRVGVLAFLLPQAAFRTRVLHALNGRSPRFRYVALATLLAAGVEGLHMISTPVFGSLRIDASIPLPEALRRYGIDLLFTVPSYLVIFSVMFAVLERVAYTPLQYAFIAALGQTLGDGGLVFFIGAPAMLLFVPYPMTNYVACNLLPYLAVRHDLRPTDTSALHAWLAVPLIVVTYFACGAVIKVAGSQFGLH